jgi:hypothetical protein
MDCAGFRDLPFDTGGRDDDQGDAWRAHLASCRACEAIVLAERVRAAGADPAAFPCVHLAFQATRVCELHDDPMDCPDAAVVHVARFREWGLPIRDGDAGTASSYLVIHHCPWCGIALAPSLRAEWHADLARRGFANPLAMWEQLPAAFRSGAWWQDGQ